jgi:hypothetical protein
MIRAETNKSFDV